MKYKSIYLPKTLKYEIDYNYVILTPMRILIKQKYYINLNSKKLISSIINMIYKLINKLFFKIFIMQIKKKKDLGLFWQGVASKFEKHIEK